MTTVMGKSPFVVAVLALAGILAGCDRPESTAPPAPVTDLAALHADVPGIAWHAGDVESAFAAARAGNRPVFLFWGARWCPTCQQLKASVFARPDFIEKSKLFVPVYLDGDLPAAQKWGDVFQVTGYPTLVILAPDRTEITRIAGGMDLTLYARVLDGALGDVRPVKELVDLAADGGEPLQADDCRRLAYHAFGLEDETVFATDRLARAFEGAARRCPAELTRERARFTLLAAGATGRAEAAAIAGGTRPTAAYRQLVGDVHGILGDRELALGNLDTLAGLGSTFFAAARQAPPDSVLSLRERWSAVADTAGSDPRFSPGDQLNAERLKLAAAKGLAADGQVPPAAVVAALTRADAMLARDLPDYDRAGVVNTALNIYRDLGDHARMRALLLQEAATSKTPWYYLGDLADVEELAGNEARAIELLREAWDRSRGPASRFQWGYNYVSGLIRLTPDDTAGIEKAGLDLLGELGGPDSIHRRTRLRLDQLEAELAAWNTTPERAAVVAKFDDALGRLRAPAA